MTFLAQYAIYAKNEVYNSIGPIKNKIQKMKSCYIYVSYLYYLLYKNSNFDKMINAQFKLLVVER